MGTRSINITTGLTVSPFVKGKWWDARKLSAHPFEGSDDYIIRIET